MSPRGSSASPRPRALALLLFGTHASDFVVPAMRTPQLPQLLSARTPAAQMVLPVDASAVASAAVPDILSHASTTTLAFADQAGNLAGTFFQLSLLPYVLFLYFLSYEKNNCPKVAFFGFQFLLLFVLSTVFTGIVTKTTYESSLADVDWLHGAAEALLTTTNLYVGLGFRGAMAGDAPPTGPSFRYPAFAIFGLVVLATAAGPALGLADHSAFLGGLGNLDFNPLADLFEWIPDEPANALSIPTWAIHFSSVFEWLFAMGMVWQYAEASGNPKWRYLTYGMLPLHASGVAACTYHFFYNSPDVSSLVALQAGLTLVGNTTVFIAALLIALSNGWTAKGALEDASAAFSRINPLSSSDAPPPAVAEAPPLASVEVPPAPLLVGELLLLTTVCSYAMKYIEPALGLPFSPNEIVGWAICVAIPAAVGYRFVSKAQAQPL